MSIWAVMAILLGITGFYIFLSLYLVFHLVAKSVIGRRDRIKSEPPSAPRLQSLLSRIKQRTAESAES
ncbi:MAG TPA: hypothetical protein VLU25_20160 [Acidobacteriota bacterium]|nr:hypothetical protein [Acidobacteriota bacterium]